MRNLELRMMFAALLLPILAGCVFDSDKGATPDSPITGIFQGHLVDGPDVASVRALIASDGTTVYSIFENPNSEVATRRFVGRTTGRQPLLQFSGEAFDGTTRSPITFTLGVDSEVILTGSIEGSELHMAQTPPPFPMLSLDKLVGDFAFLGTNHSVWQASIKTGGGLILTSPQGCIANGEVNIPDEGANVFLLKVPEAPCKGFEQGLMALGTMENLRPDTQVMLLDGHSGEHIREFNFFNQR
ncbi:MAG: hypothetical protein KA296_00015 [Marinobacter sp.]|nr:hypothetical protein [Marinobacter sp.]